MKIFLTLIFLMCTQISQAAALDISDAPMAVKNNVPPNFMFMVDNSGSMKNIVPDTPFDPKIIYTNCPSNRQISANNNEDVVLTIKSGVPKFTYGENSYTWGTGSTQRCFKNDSTYNAKLTANNSSINIILAAQYSGNYLNWYFSNDDGPLTGWVDRKKLDNKNFRVPTRLEAAKLASNATLDALPLSTGSTRPKVRVGLSTFAGSSGDTGGQLLQGLAGLNNTVLTSMKASVNDLSYLSLTPLSETLANIGRYFTLPYTGNLTLHPNATPVQASVDSVFSQDNSGRSSLFNAPASCSGSDCPVQYWCQKSNVLLLTDGRPNGDRGLVSNKYLCDYDGDTKGDCSKFGQKTGTHHPPTIHLGGAHTYEATGSNFLSDVSQALYEIDLRPDLTAPAGRLKKNNIRTYTIGFADAESQNDPQLKETALQGGGLFYTADNTSELSSVLKKAVDDALAKDGAAAAISVANTQVTVDNTAYASKYNSGYWTGDLEAFSVNTSTGHITGASVWSAQALLEKRNFSSRNIVTVNAGNNKGVIFNASNTGLQNDLSNYIRGDRSLENTGYRKRDKLLGDIINAEPVIVKYSDKTIIYQAANDGMLHVFNGSVSDDDPEQGQELWAYVPRAIHGKLNNYASPAYTHQYLVDATPAVGDLVIKSSNKKILVGGLGKGGTAYYALDISDYGASNETGYASKVLWEALAGDSRAGFSFGTPLIINTPNDGWRIVVASGFNHGASSPASGTSGDGQGRVFLINPENGVVSHVINTNAGSASTPAGLAYLSKPQGVAADAVVRHIYGGDTLGNVWRFDLANMSASKIAQLTDDAGNPQPVSSAPIVSVGELPNQYKIFLGTGLYLGDSDIPGNTPQNVWATQKQTVYGIVDDISVSSPALPNIRGSNGSHCPIGGGNGDFLCQSQSSLSTSSYSGSSYSLGSKRGWYLDLPIAGSRVTSTPQLTTGGALVATVNIPSNTACDPGGTSWLLNVKAENGGAILQTYTGTSYHPTMQLLANALGSRPLIITTATEKRALVRHADQSNSNPVIYEPPLPSSSSSGVPWRRVYWIELP